MIRSNAFEKKYPLLAPFITDTNVRNNMLNNKDLMAKYDRNNSLIKAFVNQLTISFDKETGKKLIENTIMKLPDELLVSFMTAYLNSDDVTKYNSDCLSYYMRSVNLGKEVVKYIEEHGIVSNRDYKNLPKVIVDKKFNDIILKQVPTYGEQNILMMNSELTLQEKSLFITFVESNNYNVLDMLFSNYYDLKTILAFLNLTGVNTNIINNDSLNFLGEVPLINVVFKLFASYNDINLSRNIKTITSILESGRSDLIYVLIQNDFINLAYMLENEVFDVITIQEMLSKITANRLILEKAA